MEIAHGEIDVDQSPLTGESLLVAKSAEEDSEVFHFHYESFPRPFDPNIIQFIGLLSIPHRR